MEIQKFEYLEKEKSLLDKMKSIFHNYLRVIIWLKKGKIADTILQKRITFRVDLQYKEVCDLRWIKKYLLITTGLQIITSKGITIITTWL